MRTGGVAFLAVVPGECALGAGGNLPLGLHMKRGVLQASGLLEAWLREAENRKTRGANGPYSAPQPGSLPDPAPSFVERYRRF